MLQRNPHPVAVDVPTGFDEHGDLLPPSAEVAPDAVIDWPVPIAGFEPVDPPAPEPAAATTKKTTKNAAASANGGESA